jgi:hypothetical protein
MFSQETISAGSIQYPIDNVEMENVGWACEFDCFGPHATIQPSGMLEIKAEELRAVVCATPDLLQDASFNIEQWVMRKAARAFRIKLSQAVMCGDGIGKPVGILHPASGIPVCDVAPSGNDQRRQLLGPSQIIRCDGRPAQTAERNDARTAPGDGRELSSHERRVSLVGCDARGRLSDMRTGSIRPSPGNPRAAHRAHA